MSKAFEDGCPGRPAISILPSTIYAWIDIFQAQVSFTFDPGAANELSGLYHWREDTSDRVDILMNELPVISSRRLVKLTRFHGVFA